MHKIPQVQRQEDVILSKKQGKNPEMRRLFFSPHDLDKVVSCPDIGAVILHSETETNY